MVRSRLLARDEYLTSDSADPILTAVLGSCGDVDRALRYYNTGAEYMNVARSDYRIISKPDRRCALTAQPKRLARWLVDGTEMRCIQQQRSLAWHTFPPGMS
jgi:hypothetical protein